MPILTPASEKAIDDLAQQAAILAGKPNQKTHHGKLLRRIKVWHCGGTDPYNMKKGAGLWVYKDESKSMNHAGWTASTYKADKTGAIPHPYLLTMVLGPKDLKCVSFMGLSIAALQIQHFSSDSHLGKQALCEWASLRGFDLIVDINGGEHEVLVVNPIANLRVISVECLLTGQVTQVPQQNSKMRIQPPPPPPPPPLSNLIP